MGPLTLQYAEDPSTGLPRLDGQSEDLSEADLEVLSREIDRHDEHLAGGPDNQVLALNGSGGPNVPRHFHVTVTEREKRCPTLVLEATDVPAVADLPASAEGPPPHLLPAPPGRWQGQFLAEAADLVAGMSPPGAARSPLDFILADLRALLRKDPHKFTLLLFAGYLHVGDALSLKHGESGDNPYARAAWTLLQRAGNALPAGALAPLLPETETEPRDAAGPPPASSAGWLREFFSCFCSAFLNLNFRKSM